jgi:hypothetical protein
MNGGCVCAAMGREPRTCRMRRMKFRLRRCIQRPARSKKIRTAAGWSVVAVRIKRTSEVAEVSTIYSNRVAKSYFSRLVDPVSEMPVNGRMEERDPTVTPLRHCRSDGLSNFFGAARFVAECEARRVSCGGSAPLFFLRTTFDTRRLERGWLTPFVFSNRLGGAPVCVNLTRSVWAVECRVTVPPERRRPRIAGSRATIARVAAADTTIAAPRPVTTAAKRGILRAIAAILVWKEEHHRPGIRVRERRTAAASIAAKWVIFRRIAPSRRGIKPVINVDKTDILRGIVRIPGKSELF